jgi:hypothetical protein
VRSFLGLVALGQHIDDLISGEAGAFHWRADFSAAIGAMAGGALGFESGGAVGGERRDGERDGNRNDYQQNEELGESHFWVSP